MLFAGLSNITKRSPVRFSRPSGRCRSPGNRWKRLICLSVFSGIFIMSLWLLGFNHNELGRSRRAWGTYKTFNVSTNGENIVYLDLKPGEQVEASFFSSFVNTKTCPACFKSKCNRVMMGGIRLNESPRVENRSVHWLAGSFKGSDKIQVGYVDQIDWELFEETVCQNASVGLSSCDLQTASRKSYLGNPGLLMPENMAGIHQFIKKAKSDLPLLICATDKLVSQLKMAFDENDDNRMSADEQITMMTSLLLHPGYALAKLKMRAKLSVPIPNALGACGRVVVREADWTSLTQQLDQAFEVRAGIALQIMQLVEDLQEEDPEWFFLNTDFSYDSLVRSKDGEIILINLQDTLIVDKSLFPKKVHHPLLDPEGEICNELCFHKLTSDLLHSRTLCPQLHKHGHLMQALICKNILSDIAEHKIDYYGTKPQRQTKGLLHSVPSKDHDTIEDLLRECVQETNVGGRSQAMEELRELLEKYLSYEDQDSKTTSEVPN